MSYLKAPFFSVLTLFAANAMPAQAMSARNAETVAEDARIQSEVQTALNENASVGLPNSIQAQSIGRVVYLHGLVDTGLEKAIAASIASRTKGVEQVVNSIEQNN